MTDAGSMNTKPRFTCCSDPLLDLGKSETKQAETLQAQEQPLIQLWSLNEVSTTIEQFCKQDRLGYQQTHTRSVFSA